MTKLVVLSDTHGSLNYLKKIKKRLTSEKPDYVLHLGDDYQDADQLMSKAYKLVRVPGTWTPHYGNPYIDNRMFITIEKWRFFLTHTPTQDHHDLREDINPLEVIEKRQCDIFLHGHTHRPEIYSTNNVTVINPGHLNEGDSRGYPPTFCVMQLDPKKINAIIFELNSELIFLEKNIAKP